MMQWDVINVLASDIDEFHSAAVSPLSAIRCEVQPETHVKNTFLNVIDSQSISYSITMTTSYA